MSMAFRVFIPEKWHKCQKLGMFNRFKLLACSLEIHMYASVSKSAESCWHHCQQDSMLSLLFLICRLQNEFNWTLQSPCEFLLCICLLLCLSSLLLLSCLLLSILLLDRILSSSLWLDRSTNFCLMLLTFFLFCGFIIEPAIHVTICVPKRIWKMIWVDYQVFMFCVPKVDGVENKEGRWKHSSKSKVASQVRLLLLPICVPSHNFFRNIFR